MDYRASSNFGGSAVVEPERQGFYLTKQNPLDDQTSSWYHFKKDVLPLSSTELGKIIADTKGKSNDEVGGAWLALLPQQQDIALSVAAELQKDEKSHARWVISHIQECDKEANKGHAAAKLLLILERIVNITSPTAAPGTAMDFDRAAPITTHKEERARIVDNIVKKAFDDPSHPQGSIVQRSPGTRNAQRSTDEYDGNRSDTAQLGSRGYVSPVRFGSSGHGLSERSHSSRGLNTSTKNEQQAVGPKQQDQGADGVDRERIKRKVRLHGFEHEREREGSTKRGQHHHERRDPESLDKGHTAKTDILKKMSAEQVQMKHERMGRQTDGEMFSPQWTRRPQLDPSQPIQHHQWDPFPCPPQWMQDSQPDSSRSTQSRQPNQFAYTPQCAPHSRPNPVPPTQHPPPSARLWTPSHSTNPFPFSMAEHPQAEPGERRTRSYSSSSEESTPSPPAEPLISPTVLEMKNLEIDALKNRLQQQLQLNMRRERMDRQKEAEPAQVKQVAGQRAASEADVNAIKSLFERYEKGRDAREAAWCKEREAEAAAKATAIAKEEEQRRLEEHIHAMSAKARVEAEERAVEAAKKTREEYRYRLAQAENAEELARNQAKQIEEERNQETLTARRAKEEYTKELSKKTQEIEQLQVRLEAESRLRREQTDFIQKAVQTAAIVRTKAEDNRDASMRTGEYEARHTGAQSKNRSKTDSERRPSKADAFEESSDIPEYGSSTNPWSGEEDLSDDSSTAETAAHHALIVLRSSSSEHPARDKHNGLKRDKQNISHRQVDNSDFEDGSDSHVSWEASREVAAVNLTRVPPDDRLNSSDKGLEASLIHIIAIECYNSVDADLAQTWLRDGNAVKQSERLIRDFAVLLQRKVPDDQELGDLLAIVFQERTQIIARLRDMVFSSGKIKASTSGQEQTDWLSNARYLTRRKEVTFHSLGSLTRRLKALIETPDFRWLVKRMEHQSLFSETGCAASDNRSRLVRVIASLPAGSSLRLSLGWDLIAFPVQQYSADRNDIEQWIVYCGLARAAYATTIGEYTRSMWPQAGSLVLECIQSACSNPSRTAQSEGNGVSLEIQLQPGRTLVCISEHTDNAVGMLEIAEACTWLSVACRENHLDECMTYCSANFMETNDEMDHLRVTGRLHDINTSGSQDGLCWSKMVGNPVVAWGYPIPKRHKPTEQKGLEISLDMMIALSHAYWATNFGTAFVLKGLISALVPVLEVGSSLVWHFLLNQDGSRMTYQQACASASKSTITLHGREDLEKRRHFVGVWSHSARIMAGGSDAELYNNLQLSTSKPVDQYTVSVSNLSFSAGQYLTVGGAFKIARKDTAPLLQKTVSDTYGLHIRHARNMSVVFYGTHDRRAWLLDGASALMHLARSWMSCEGNPRITAGDLDRLVYRDQRCDRDSAISALETNQSSNIRIFDDIRSQWQDSREITPSSGPLSRSDSGYYSSSYSRKAKHKKIVSEWSFKELVLHIWHVLETMHDKMHSSKFRAPEFAVKKPTLRPVLTGWETRDILTRRGPFESRRVELKPAAGPWLQYVKEQSAIVLLAWTFGDLILPEKGTGACSRFSKMPSGYDYLAVPLYVLYPQAQRFLRDNNGCSTGCVQISDYTYWHGFGATAHHCERLSSCACNIISTMSHRPKRTAKLDHCCANVFDKFPEGVAIIGDSKTASTSSWIRSQWYQKTLSPKTLQKRAVNLELRLPVPYDEYEKGSRHVMVPVEWQDEPRHTQPLLALSDVSLVKPSTAYGEALTPRTSPLKRRPAEADLYGTHFENQINDWRYFSQNH